MRSLTGGPIVVASLRYGVEYLVRLTKKAVQDRRFELYCNGDVVVEPILAFTDDIAFFCKASTKSFQVIRSILEEFSSFSGLQVNTTKSHAIFSKRVRDGDSLAVILGFPVHVLPVKYLGVLLTGKSICHWDCAALIADLQGILEWWNQRCLS